MKSMNRDKLKKHIPNLFTLANMSFGLASILLLIQADHPHKAIIVPVFIFLGGVADFFDGYFARTLNVSTNMGKQLDSFADIITFGIAPIALVYYLSVSEHSIFLMLASLIFLISGAYRLARYNLRDFSNYFMGLPITAAGVILAIYCVVYPYLIAGWHSVIRTIITTLFLCLLSVLMVSRKKVKRFYFFNQKSQDDN
jgi:CDP-diacylglycerol--serine O-phosphatidyltransferase